MAERYCRDPRQQRGADAEAAAERWLCGRGLRLVARNYRCRRGEIDLVMRDGDCVVFVEVRLRSRNDFGGATASVDSAKQRRLVIAAQHFLLHQPQFADAACRFDVIADDGRGDWQWLRDAFQVN